MHCWINSLPVLGRDGLSAAAATGDDGVDGRLISLITSFITLEKAAIDSAPALAALDRRCFLAAGLSNDEDDATLGVDCPASGEGRVGRLNKNISRMMLVG